MVKNSSDDGKRISVSGARSRRRKATSYSAKRASSTNARKPALTPKRHGSGTRPKHERVAAIRALLKPPHNGTDNRRHTASANFWHRPGYQVTYRLTPAAAIKIRILRRGVSDRDIFAGLEPADDA